MPSGMQPPRGEERPELDERELRESEARYRQLADAMPQLAWTSDAAGVVDYYNARAADYAGLTRSADGSWTWQAVLHPDDLDGTVAAWAAAQSADTYQFEHRIGMRDGSYRWHLSRAQAIRDVSGQLVRWFGTATDIDDRRRAEDAAERLRRRLTFLADLTMRLTASLDYRTRLEALARQAVPFLADFCVVYIQGGDGWITRVALAHRDSDRERELLARQGEGLIDPHGANPAARVFREGEPIVVRGAGEAHWRAAAEGPGLAEAARLLAAHSYMALPLALRGQIFGAIAFMLTDPARAYDDEDVSFAGEVARRAAIALDNARLYRDAQEAIRLRDQFLSVAAHELKTPLTALLGNAQLLQRRTQRTAALGEREQHNLDVIVQQAQRLSDLVVTLLDISRLETGQLAIRREPLDLGALVRRTVEESRGSLEGRPVDLRCPDGIVVLGDSLRLEQVFQNLLQNAAKYSPPGGPIAVAAWAEGGAAAVAVRDEGIGIPADAIPHLFQRFYRAENAVGGSASGIGIGLFVVREIVALHGGSVAVESEPGRGSTFTVTLPLAPAPEAS